MMKAPEQKLIYQAFHERMGQTLKKYGFVFRKNYYYRKNGRIFQVIGLDISASFTHLFLYAIPYWALEYQHNYGIMQKSPRVLQVMQKNGKLVEGVDFTTFDRYYQPGYLFPYLSSDVEAFCEVLNQIKDEDSFCRIMDEKIYNYSFMLPCSVLYCALQRGSLDYAREWYEKERKEFLEGFIANEVIRYAKDHPEFGQQFFEDYRNFYRWWNLGSRDMRLKSEFFEKEKMNSYAPYLLSQFEKIDPNSAWKQNVLNQAEIRAHNIMYYRFSELKAIIDSGDLDWIKRIVEEEEPLMREFFLKTLKLDFSE